MPTMANSAEAALPATGQSDDLEHRDTPRRRRSSRTRREEAPRDHRTRTSSSRVLTLKVAARELMWHYDHKHGMSLEEIAGYERLTVKRVLEGVRRAEALQSQRSSDEMVEDLKSGRLDDARLRLIPLFPVTAFTPRSTCPHHDTIERGSRLCCMVCHASGMDDHPGFRHDAKTDPSPEPTPAPAADVTVSSKSGTSKETRKQRRRRQLAEASVV